MLQQWVADNLLTLTGIAVGFLFSAAKLVQALGQLKVSVEKTAAALDAFLKEYQEDRLQHTVKSAEQAKDIKSVYDALSSHEKQCEREKRAIWDKVEKIELKT